MRFVLGLCLFGAVAIASAQAPRKASATATVPRRAIELRYLGNAGWEISDGRTVVLVDPYISQFHMVDSVGGQPRPMRLDSATIVAPDTASINARIPRADYILVTHGHLDHALECAVYRDQDGCHHHRQ